MDTSEALRNFCIIQLQVIKNRKTKLRKELLDCDIQREFIVQTLQMIDKDFEVTGADMERMLIKGGDRDD